MDVTIKNRLSLIGTTLSISDVNQSMIIEFATDPVTLIGRLQKYLHQRSRTVRPGVDRIRGNSMILCFTSVRNSAIVRAYRGETIFDGHVHLLLYKNLSKRRRMKAFKGIGFSVPIQTPIPITRISLFEKRIEPWTDNRCQRR